MVNLLQLALMSLSVGVADAGIADSEQSQDLGRVVEGRIATTGRKPIPGARILFGQPDVGFVFVEDAMAPSDAQGRYRIDLGKHSWSKGVIRAVVLAPGFGFVDRTLEPGVETADFEMIAQPWKETQVCLKDSANRPVPGVGIAVKVGGGAIWSRLKTDAEGCCRVAMAPEIWISLSAEPDGARPSEAVLGVTRDGPSRVTLPVLPPLRGRVSDPEGRPVPDVAIGRWVSFGSDGAGRMLPFYGGEPATTDRHGVFAIRPKVELTHGELALPALPRRSWALVFAGRNYQDKAYRLIDPYGPNAPLEVVLERGRRVRVPIERSLAPLVPNEEFEARYLIAPRPGPSEPRFFINRDLSAASRGETMICEEALPPGRYRLEVSLIHRAAHRHWKGTRDFVVSRGDSSLDLPPLKLEPFGLWTLAGKPAPEIEATDLDTGRPVKLAELRGKVVVLDFWGYWCGPCTGNMPHLVDLQKKFAGQPLEIVALHD